MRSCTRKITIEGVSGDYISRMELLRIENMAKKISKKYGLKMAKNMAKKYDQKYGQISIYKIFGQYRHSKISDFQLTFLPFLKPVCDNHRNTFNLLNFFWLNYDSPENSVHSLVRKMTMVPVCTRIFSFPSIGEIGMRNDRTLADVSSSVHPVVVGL